MKDVAEELAGIYDGVLPRVKRNLEEDALVPVVFALFPRADDARYDLGIIAVRYSAEDKYAAYASLCRGLREKKSAGFVAFNDVWIAAVPPDDDLATPASARDNRREALVASFIVPAGALRLVTHYYRREGDPEQIVWEECDDTATWKKPRVVSTMFQGFIRRDLV